MKSVNTAFRNVRFFDAPIGLRVFYAVVAALLWWAMAELDRVIWGVGPGLLFYATGGVFSALVLVPYVPSLKGTFKLRAIGLLLVGMLSYWLAVLVGISVDDTLMPVDPTPDILFGVVMPYRAWPWTVDLAIAGVCGALIVGIGARLLVPMTLRWLGWLMLIGAGCLGGALVGIGQELHRFGDDQLVFWWPGHIAWEVLVCLALYYGSERATNLIP